MRRAPGATLLALGLAVALSGCAGQGPAAVGTSASTGSWSPTPAATATSSPGPSVGSLVTGDTLPGEGLVVATVDGEPCTSIPLASPQACAPRPLAGVRVTVTDGTETVATTGDDGRVDVPLEPGTYRVEGDPVPGFRITPQPVVVDVQEGHAVVALLAYSRGFQ